MNPPSSTPLVSVVVLNYHGARWLERCLASLKEQTLAPQTEVIVADNASSDGSDRLAEQLVDTMPNARFIQHGANLGYCEGNNRAVPHTRGRYLFFLNNDTWLEPDCLERLVDETQKAGAQAASPRVLNYSDDRFQSLGAAGFDLFGLCSTRREFSDTREIFMPEGCAYLIEREVFQQLGGFDPVLFMFSDELDLSWRLWVAGHRAVAVPAARLHHRGAAQVNPKGEVQAEEFRTSDRKRFYANRNGLLVPLKNAQHLLLILVPFQLLLLTLELAAGLILVRRWSFVRKAYLAAFEDCWRLRGHLASERQRLEPLRKRSDAWMLRFLRWRFNRWDEVIRLIRQGPPKVTAD